MSETIARIIARIGTTTLFALLSATFIAALIAIRFYEDALFALAALGGTMGTAGIIKMCWFVKRPEDALLPLTSSALPSGHAAASMALSLSVLVIMYPYLTTPALFYLFLFGTIITIGIAWSRIALRVHRPHEVFAGIAIALFWACTSAVCVYAL